jgi:hypothetical protein
MSVSHQAPWTLSRIEEFLEDLVASYRDLLNGQTLAATAHLRELLPVYAAELLPEVDRRIVECHALLRRGLRDEALGLALESPDLLRTVDLLNLDRFGRDEVRRWKEASDAAGLVWPTSPREDLLGDFPEAESAVVELRPLLARWRLLNIGRRPLPERLAVLRELYAREPAATVWRELLETHEAFRITEIRATLKHLRERFSTTDDDALDAELGALRDELQGEWICTVPPDELGRRATELEVRARERRIDKVLNRLTGELEIASAALADTEAPDRVDRRSHVTRLVEQWHAAVEERGVLAADDPRLIRVSAVLEYVSRLSDVERLLAEVGQGVAERPEGWRARVAWAESLERMMDKIDDAVTRLPPADIDVGRYESLSARVARIVDEVQREAWFHRFLVAGAVAAVVLMGLFLTWRSFDHRRHEALVGQTIEAVETEIAALLLGDDRPVAAFDQDWTGRLRGDPRVTAAVGRLRQVADAQDARRARFQELLQATREAVTAARLAERPNPLDPWPEAFATATRTLDTIRRGALAVTDREKAMLPDPSAAVSILAQGLLQAADDAFISEVKKLEEGIGEIDLALANHDVGRANLLLGDLQKRLDTLVALTTMAACPTAASPHGATRLVSSKAAAAVSPESRVRTQLAAARRKHGLYANLEARERRADELLDRGEFAQYADALRAIATDLDALPASRDYRAVADGHPYWKALAAWDTVLPSLRDAAHVTGDRAQDLRKLLAALPAETVRLPFIADASTWLDAVLAKAEEIDHDTVTKAKDGLRYILEGQYGTKIDGVAWLRDEGLTSARFYFLLRDRPLPDKSRRVDHVVQWPDRLGVWGKKSIGFSPTRYSLNDSPQKLLALHCLSVVDKIPKDRVSSLLIDRFAVELLECCSERQPAGGPDRVPIDPCLHALLLRYVMLETWSLSPFVRSRMPDSQRWLEAGDDGGQPIQIKGADNEAFALILDPEKQRSSAMIVAARTTCEQFIETARRETGLAKDALDRESAALAEKHKTVIGYRCVGRLRRLSTDGWSIGGGTATTRRMQPLFVLDDASNTLAMTPCVTCDDQGGIPTGTKVAGRAGQPVFVRVTLEEDF